MSIVAVLKEKVLSGQDITREEAVSLIDAPLEELATSANEIREKMCKESFDLCSIVNGKCGRCSEDCKYCAQSGHYNTACQESYPLLSTEKIMELARKNDANGVMRYSIVTSGKSLNDKEIEQVCETITTIKNETGMSVCASFGLINEKQLKKIKEAGVTRIHCNLETSKAYFDKICSTHTYDEKIKTIKTAKSLGFSICSGGIIGLGESMEDRIDLALAERELGTKSIPINILNPVKGTPLENNEILPYDEIIRVIAIFRFILPKAFVRLAGGRGLLEDKGVRCFKSGANATISGDLLTTIGVTVEDDVKLIQGLGFEINRVK
jgi:biotin synthase